MNEEQKGSYTADGVKAIADALRVSASLTAANLQNNRLDDAAKQMLRDSVKDRAGFKLEL
mgnify:CR=1 FL=1